MAARHLVADGDFALLCNINADKFMNAGREFVLVFAAENANVNNNAALAVRNAQEVSRTFAPFSPKIALSRRSSAVSSVSPFGVTLPTRMSPE